MRTTRALSEKDRLPDAWITVESAATLSLPARYGNRFSVRLTSDAVLEPPVEPHPGQQIILKITQDTTGGWALTPNAAGITTRGSLILNAAAGAVSVWMLLYDEDAKMWDAVGVPDLSAVYQPLNATLTEIGTVAPGADRFIYFDGASDAQVAPLTAAGREILDDVDAPAQRTTLGLGTIATKAIIAAQADSTAASLADLVTDFNALLAKMRTSGALAT